MAIGNLHQQDRGIANESMVVYLATFPPRKCGIATFTYDLTQAIDNLLEPELKSKIITMNPSRVAGYRYSRKVVFQVDQENREGYITVAEKLNKIDAVRVVNIQHEFGIFGGEWGLYLIPFLRTLTKPKVITFHTVLPNPSESLQSTVGLLDDNSDAIVVMTQLSRSLLIKDYGISAEKIRIIPHGIHDRPYVLSELVKGKLGFRNKTVLMTFGMLHRGKGLEYVIEGLPRVLEMHQDFVYIIIGATHPSILHVEGETYRNSLIQRINELGLSNHVKLYNQYFSTSELLNFLSAADIYISTSIDPSQAVSGTLSYAMGAGRPVISTPFAHAKEIVTDDVGILVDFRNPQAFADAIMRLLEDEGLRMSLGKNAYFKTRSWTWPNVAIKYSSLFGEFASDMAETMQRKTFPQVKLTHLERLTDDFGIVQFAKLSQPDLSSGYTLDDNARALMVVVLYYDKLHSELRSKLAINRKRLLRLIDIYLNFIMFSAGHDIYFQNYVNADRVVEEECNKRVNLEETSGRALYALALTSSIRSLPKRLANKAFAALQEKIEKNVSFESPRAIAWYVKAICVLLNKNIRVPETDLEETLRQHCSRLVSLYKATRSPGWEWFESYLTYSNGLLSEALLQAYQVTGEDSYLGVGKTTLDFLIERSFHKDLYVPVGQDGWSYRDGEHNHFDQQPEAVMSMVHALKACYTATGEEHYNILMRRAFNWFLGDNSLGQLVYDRTTGGCYDGVRRNDINLNQGAESTVSYLLARLVL